MVHSLAFAGPVQEIVRRWTGMPAHPENRLEIAWPTEEATPPAPLAATWEPSACRTAVKYSNPTNRPCPAVTPVALSATYMNVADRSP